MRYTQQFVVILEVRWSEDFDSDKSPLQRDGCGSVPWRWYVAEWNGGRHIRDVDVR